MPGHVEAFEFKYPRHLDKKKWVCADIFVQFNCSNLLKRKMGPVEWRWREFCTVLCILLSEYSGVCFITKTWANQAYKNLKFIIGKPNRCNLKFRCLFKCPALPLPLVQIPGPPGTSWCQIPGPREKTFVKCPGVARGGCWSFELIDT